MIINNLKFRKIFKEEFDKLKSLFPDNDELWKEYRTKRLAQFDRHETDIFVIENNDEFIGEITVNYVNHNLSTETIPDVRVYLEAFRLKEEYQNQGLGQKLVQFAIDSLQIEGYTEFTIGVEENNDVAKHIYFKYGFTEAIDHGHGDKFDDSAYTLYLRR